VGGLSGRTGQVVLEAVAVIAIKRGQDSVVTQSQNREVFSVLDTPFKLNFVLYLLAPVPVCFSNILATFSLSSFKSCFVA